MWLPIRLVCYKPAIWDLCKLTPSGFLQSIQGNPVSPHFFIWKWYNRGFLPYDFKQKMQNRGLLHFLFLILWFIWEEGCLISGRRSRKVWSLMRQPLQTAGKPHPSVCPGHAQSRRESLMRWAQWADVKKSWFLKKLHRQRPNPCRNSSNRSPGWLFLVNLEKMSVKSSILLTFFLIFSIFYIFEVLSTPQNSILWKFDDKISKINKLYQRRKICCFSRLQRITP